MIVLIFSLSLPVYAGSTQSTESKYTASQVDRFSKDVEKFAANKGARAFLIARVGRPVKELPEGINFTHTAIALYSTITLDSGEKVKGYAIHNLYQKEGEPNKSELVIDYPVDFFWGVDSLKAGIIIPSEALQMRVIDVIAKGKDKKLHNEEYSVIANPFNNKFQNCTEHTLNLLNAGIYNSDDIIELKSHSAQHFSPHKIDVNPVKLLLGNWFVDDVSLNDHTGDIYTTTFTSLGEYLKTNELVNTAVVLNSDGSIEQLL